MFRMKIIEINSRVAPVGRNEKENEIKRNREREKDWVVNLFSQLFLPLRLKRFF